MGPMQLISVLMLFEVSMFDVVNAVGEVDTVNGGEKELEYFDSSGRTFSRFRFLEALFDLLSLKTISSQLSFIKNSELYELNNSGLFSGLGETARL